LAEGSFAITTPIPIQKGDVWQGAGASQRTDGSISARTLIQATAGAQQVFRQPSGSGGSGPMTLRFLDISGAVGSSSCLPHCGAGVLAFGTVRIEMSRIHHNQLNGFSDVSGVWEDVEIDHNGLSWGRDCCSGGLKSVTGGVTVRRAFVHDNDGNGIWCDFCRVQDGEAPFVIEHSTIVNNGKDGLHYEVSDVGATIRNNRIQGNNTINNAYDGGIDILQSQNALVENNVLGSNRMVEIAARWYPRTDAYTLNNIIIRNNALNGGALTGCGSGVSCENNG
jgi:hypothetical protein